MDPTPPAQNVLPIEPEYHAHSTNWLALILIAIISLVFAGGAIYFAIQAPKPELQVTKIKPTPTPDVTANWKTYTNSVYKYSIKYPEDITIEEKDPRFVWIGKQIYIAVSPNNPENCRGDCPVIETAKDTMIGGLNARKLSGYIGAIGGSTPQSYQKIVISNNQNFYSFTLYELDRNAIDSPTRQRGGIAKNKIELFDQILSTFRFE